MINKLCGVNGMDGLFGDLGQLLFDILANIPKLVYFLISTLMSLLDLFQFLFRRIAGLDVYYVDGVEYSGDILYGFLSGIITGKYPVLQTIFWSMIILGIILLVISSILSVIKSEFNPDKDGKAGNGKGEVVKTIFRSLFLMFIIPVASIFGIYFCNLVLRAVDSATLVSTNESVLASYTYTDTNQNTQSAFAKNEKGTYSNYDIFGITTDAGYTPFSGLVFKVCVFQANRARLDPDFVTTVLSDAETSKVKTGNFGVFDKPSTDAEKAELIDVAFANNARLNNEYKGAQLDIHKGVADKYIHPAIDIFGYKYNNKVNNFCKSNMALVHYYYNIWYFNFILAILFIKFIASFYLGITVGLIKRIITFLALFLAAPVFVAPTPLKNLNGDKGPTAALVKNGISVIGTVGAVNLFMSILPLFQVITFFPPGILWDFINSLIQLFIIIAGFEMIKDLINIINQSIGGESLDGTELLQKGYKDTNRAIGTLRGVTTRVANGEFQAVQGAVGAIRHGARGVGSFISGTIGNRRDRNTLRDLDERNSSEEQNQLDRNTNDLRDFQNQFEISEERQAQQDDIELENEMNSAYNSYVEEHGATDRQTWMQNGGGQQLQDEILERNRQSSLSRRQAHTAQLNAMTAHQRADLDVMRANHQVAHNTQLRTNNANRIARVTNTNERFNLARAGLNNLVGGVWTATAMASDPMMNYASRAFNETFVSEKDRDKAEARADAQQQRNEENRRRAQQEQQQRENEEAARAREDAIRAQQEQQQRENEEAARAREDAIRAEDRQHEAEMLAESNRRRDEAINAIIDAIREREGGENN